MGIALVIAQTTVSLLFLMKKHAYSTFQLPYGADSPWSGQDPTSILVEVVDLAATVDGSNGVQDIYSTSSHGQRVLYISIQQQLVVQLQQSTTF